MLIPDGMPPGTDAAAGVIGYPVRHSLSPAICQAALDHLGLDWIYAAFEVPAGQAGRALDHMRARGMVGLSVTMPHKADVADAVDGLSPAAAALGAVNCVARDHDRLIGHNTDGAGFCDALLAEGVDPAGIRCAVLGAGGAARAVVAELARRGAAEVAVIARRPDRAESAAGLAGPVGTTARPNSIGRYHLVVNATPVGMAGTEGAGALPLDPRSPHLDPSRGRTGLQPPPNPAAGRVPDPGRARIHRGGDAGASSGPRRANLDRGRAPRGGHERRGHHRARAPQTPGCGHHRARAPRTPGLRATP